MKFVLDLNTTVRAVSCTGLGVVALFGTPATAKHEGLKHLKGTYCITFCNHFNSDSEINSENNVCFLCFLLLQSGCASEMPWLVTTDILTAHFTH